MLHANRSTRSRGTAWQVDAASADEAPSLASVLSMLRRRAGLIALFTILGLLAGLAFLKFVPPAYQGSALVLLDPREINVLATPQVLPGIGSDAAAVESQVELISSNKIIQTIIAELGLANHPDLLASPGLANKLLPQLFPHRQDSEAVAESRLVDRFRKNLNVRRRGLTYVLEVNYKSTDPVLAARVANALAAAYLADLQAAKSGATTEASDWLGERIQIRRRAVEISDKAVVDYKKQHNIVDVGQDNTGDTVFRRRIGSLNQELAGARAATAQAKARVDQIEAISASSGDLGSLAAVLDSKVISDLRVNYSQVLRTEAEFSQIYGKRHPRLIAIREQKSRIETQIDGEIRRYRTSAANEYEIARNLENSLRKEMAELETKAAAANEVNVELEELKRNAEANRQIYTQLLGRAKQTTAEKSLTKSQARVVSQAMVPVKPERLPSAVIAGFAAFAGLLAGLGAAVSAEAFDTGLRTKKSLEDCLYAPCFGVLPSAAVPRSRGQSGGTCRMLRLVHEEPETQFSRAVRDAQHRICSRALDDKVLLVSSARNGAGKSTFACNLALSISSGGASCMLIDLEPGQATVTGCLATRPETGLLHVLNGDASIEEATVADEASGLLIMPHARLAAGAGEAEALLAQKLPAFIETCREKFDFIVLDGPAVIDGQGVPLLADAADAIVLVVEAGKTTSADIAATQSLLTHGRARISGAVLNKADPAKA